MKGPSITCPLIATRPPTPGRASLVQLLTIFTVTVLRRISEIQILPERSFPGTCQNIPNCHVTFQTLEPSGRCVLGGMALYFIVFVVGF